MRISSIAAITAFAIALSTTPIGAAEPSVVQRIVGPDGGWDLLSVDPAHDRRCRAGAPV